MITLDTILSYGLAVDQQKNYNAFTGISVACPFFKNNLEDPEFYFQSIQTKNIDLVCSYALQRFEKFLVVIGDTLLTYNFMGFCNMTESEAREKALVIGGYWYDACNKITKTYNPRIKLLKWSDFSHDQIYIRYTKSVSDLASKNHLFKLALKASTLASIPSEFKEVKKRYGIEAAQKVLEISTNYSLEEICGLLYIHETQGYQIYISKYEPHSILKAIYGGHYPELSNSLNLTKFGHIQVCAQGKKVHCDDPLLELHNTQKIIPFLGDIL